MVMFSVAASLISLLGFCILCAVVISLPSFHSFEYIIVDYLLYHGLPLFS